MNKGQTMRTDVVLLAGVLFVGACAPYRFDYTAHPFPLTGQELSLTAHHDSMGMPENGGHPGARRETLRHLLSLAPNDLLKTRVNPDPEDTPDEILLEYGLVVTKCSQLETAYSIKQADAADHAAAAKTLVATIAGALGTGAGTVGGATSNQSTSKNAGWAAAVISLGGLVVAYFVSPGDAGSKARATVAQTINADAQGLQGAIGHLGSDATTWSMADRASVVGKLHTLDGECSVAP